jgi:hypothetical protein
MSKNRKPRDPIYRLRIPNSNPTQYERCTKRMAKLARDYHENLQNEDINPQENKETHHQKTEQFLQEVPNTQKLEEPTLSPMNWEAKRPHVEEAIHLAKCASAPGMDGCPYELWKKLKEAHDEALKKNEQSFDITEVLTAVFNDIQKHGVDSRMNFSLGWMCPVYKKKDPTDISNYCPITLLNTDYKLLTKVLALQLTESAQKLVHPDQVGFIPRRSIFDLIRLANAIINYAELTEEDGAIVALDQEKAYDKIRHDYLWATMDSFGIPKPFTNTVRSLYQNAQMVVMINGVKSEPYLVTRGVRQGDPLSCPLFDIAIEPLACKIRNDPEINGIRIPGQPEKLAIKLFVDDTNLYLSKEDSFDHIQKVLNSWCEISGAKFNIEKTEVIPIGTTEHRQRVVSTRKLNEHDQGPLTERIHIAKDGESIRMLGAWIGNKTKDDTPWETIIDRINSNLERWKRLHPTLNGRKLIIQAMVGGHTQFLASAQGMPQHIETALKRIIKGFMWDDDSSPRIACDTLCQPIKEGGLDLLDISARNEAIDIIWLRRYLNFSPLRPTWAAITDIIVQELAPRHAMEEIEFHPFLQCWNIPTPGHANTNISNNIKRMLGIAKKYKTNLTAICLTPHLNAQLPAWYHLATEYRPMTGAATKCLINKHQTRTVADLLRTSHRIRNAPTEQHNPSPYCRCQDCERDKQKNCLNPHACATKVLTRLQLITPKLNPLTAPPQNQQPITDSDKES